MSDRLTVAVVGLGIGQHHAQAYQASGRCDLRWVCDRNLDKARQVGEGLGAQPTTDFQQIIDDPDIDAVSIASFDQDHFEQTLAALEAGKHVFVEKPVCRSAEEADRLQAAWSRHKGRVVLASNLVLRTAPLYVWLRQALADGDLGEPYAFDGDYLYGRLHKITEGWRKDVPDYSVMLGGGIHLIDLLLWCTRQRPTWVHAVGNRITTEGTPFRYPDFVQAQMHFDSGLVSRISANFGCVHPHQHVVRLFGTRATFLHDDNGPRLHTSRAEDARAQPLKMGPLPAGKGALIPDFVDAAIEGRDLRRDTQAFLDGVRVAHACDLSVRDGRPVRVNYP